MRKVVRHGMGIYFPKSGRKGGFLPNAAPDAPHVQPLGSCTKGCADAPPFEDRHQGAKKEEAVPLSNLRGEDAQAALGGCIGGARRRHGDEFSNVSGIRAQHLMELSKEDLVRRYARTI